MDEGQAFVLLGTKMGDSRRGALFAQFIVRQFPRASFILDIAGGKGQVARSLANKGRRVHIIDAKPRLEGRTHPLISYQKGFFQAEDKLRNHIKPDLIIGLHPDEATGEIIRFASRHCIPFAVVPCCIKGRDANGVSNFRGWLNKLIDLAEGLVVSEYQLKMAGKNITLYGRVR
jgi:hypothetical protein